jgi:extradiol dioxygenase family protein
MYPIADVARARRFYEETPGLKRGSMGKSDIILLHQLEPKAQ